MMHHLASLGSTTPGVPRRNTATAVVDRDLEHISRVSRAELEEMAGRSVLITGGAGFLGYYLVQAPLWWNRRFAAGRRIRVTVWDTFRRGVPSWLKSAQDDCPELTVETRDVTRSGPREGFDFDYVVHAASIASPRFYRAHPIETMDANVNGLRMLLDRASERSAAGKPIRGFLFFSSSEIYGDADAAHIPTPETYNGNVSCTGPRACYDESKRFGETLCVNFARAARVPAVIVRPFNNYGPGLRIDDGRVVSDFARDLLNDGDVVMLSDGSPRRTFCYVADAVSGYFKALVRGRPGEAYNIGTEEPEVSVAQLAERMAGLAGELFGYRGRVIRRSDPDPDYLVDNPNRRRPAIDKARHELGYEPAIPLEEGLRRTLLWYVQEAARM